MKALSIKNPFAELIKNYKKTIEIRSRNTNFRGEFLVCASLKAHSGHYIKNGLPVPCKHYRVDSLLYGYAIATAKLIDCRPMLPQDEKLAMCAYYPYLYSWILDDIKQIKPFKVKGQLGFFNLDTNIIYKDDIEIIKEAQLQYYKKLSFKEISKKLNISISKAVRYCTDLKYSKL